MGSKKTMDYLSIIKYISYDLSDQDEIKGLTWWALQGVAQLLNLYLMISIIRRKDDKYSNHASKQKWLCFLYFTSVWIRAVWPRHDINKTCFFDTLISTVIVGRTLATIGELCFITQCKIAVITLSKNLFKLGRGNEKTHYLIQSF